MKKYCKFSFIMVIIVIVSNILPNIKVLAQERVRLNFVIPENVEPPKSYEEVTNRLLAWKDIIQDGTIWNEHTPYGDMGYLGEYYEWNAYPPTIYSKACEAFAQLLSDVIFGDLPATCYGKDKISYEQIRPGDILTFDNPRHDVIVIRVNNDETITIAEANVNGGVVRWGKVRSKEYIMSRIVGLYTRYPEGFVDGQPTVSTSTAPLPTQTPVAPIATSAPVTQIPVTPITTATPVYRHAKEQRVEKPYMYLYDSNNDKVDMFMLKSKSITYKGKKISFKPIRWADFNESGTIIVIQKNSVYYSVKSTINGVKIKKLGKGAKKRQKKNGLIITIATQNGKKINVANL